MKATLRARGNRRPTRRSILPTMLRLHLRLSDAAVQASSFSGLHRGPSGDGTRWNCHRIGCSHHDAIYLRIKSMSP
jgi:hypothetical protein